jgi:outer membrane beta-barrel protein
MLVLLAMVGGQAWAAENTAFSDEQVIQPTVETQDVNITAIDTEDIEIGIYRSRYITEDFGSNSTVGARIAYHVSEDFFAEASVGETTLSKTTAEDLFDFDTLNEEERDLRYYDIVVGWNMFPGETYFGSSWAFPMQLYLTAGMGTTEFAGEKRSTLIGGLGYRLLLTDWMAMHIDFRDHMYDVTVLTEEKSSHNIEARITWSFFF